MSFEDIIERNMDAIIEIQKLETKEKTFKDFLARIGKIEVKRVDGKLALPTLRLLNRYRDEWVFIQLEAEWTEALKARRDNVEHPKKYLSIYNEDMALYKNILDRARDDLLQAHEIAQEEYEAAGVQNLSLHLENQVADCLWTYWAFKNSGTPTILTKKEMLKALDTMAKIAKKTEKHAC